MSSTHNSQLQMQNDAATKHSIHAAQEQDQINQAIISKALSQIQDNQGHVSKAVSFHQDVVSKALSCIPADPISSKHSAFNVVGDVQLAEQVVQELEEVKQTGDLGALSKAAQAVLTKHMSKVSHVDASC